MDQIHLQKLCVGADGPADLLAWQQGRPDQWGGTIHVTRSRPRRAEELLAGGSLYWVMKGAIACRQLIIGLEEVRGADGVNRCAIVLDRTLIRTTPTSRRAFQGWRYLEAEAAPRDIGPFDPMAEELPAELQKALMDIGVF